MSVVCGLGEACRATRSALGGDSPDRALPEIWDAVWANVSAALDFYAFAEAEASTLPMTPTNGSLAKVETPVIPIPFVDSRPAGGDWGAIGLIGSGAGRRCLLVVGLTWHHSHQDPATRDRQGHRFAIGLSQRRPHRSKSVGFQSVSVVDIDEGRLVVIHVEDSAAEIVDLTPEAAIVQTGEALRNLESALVDDWY